ncbi:MAG: ribbon-helix-helix protein, CopG family [Chromatiales bacterium]|nr:ribbon-helix-helix protein, CopG family [Chromatiales bacterium]
MFAMRKNVKIIGFSVPVELAAEVDELVRRERRTKTEVFQAMFRLYQQESRKQEAAFDRRVLAVIAETEEEKRTNQKTPEALTAAFENYARYGAERAEAVGTHGTRNRQLGL